MRGDGLWVLALVVATAFCLACSFCYHLCNCTGRLVKECMYRMDLTGIVALIGVSYFTGIALAFHCAPTVRKFYLFYAAGVVLALAAPLLRPQIADLTKHFIVCVGSSRTFWQCSAATAPAPGSSCTSGPRSVGRGASTSSATATKSGTYSCCSRP
eukprot:UN4819